MTEDCGRLLAAGLRACADLAEQARARRDDPAAQAAEAAAGELASRGRGGWSGSRSPTIPYVGAIPAARATWEAEWTRLAGASDPAAWHEAAKTWESLGCPHRAGYAFWRQAQAQLDAGQPVTAAAAALRAAAAAADGHAPLLAQVRALAERARIPLQAPRAASGETARAPEAPAPYGLTEPRTSGAAAARRGADQQADRRRAVHQPDNGPRACQQHPAQTRRDQPGAGRRGGRAGWPAGPGAALNTSRRESKRLPASIPCGCTIRAAWPHRHPRGKAT